ncbi:hypothetical protein N7462_009230 [Penicillium macrosclerotiorum]|uniref:uncharacterized protein n=1 Tax=Penicillium macrosclerotiorum TaxID=303699 RepID=UPI0025470A4D|nr:uncharacterized protein N7462_009230 [Penicillium macrosclerotiorum]KAJ5673791.1 hypothetical protein N7462_009230 [Penicillium macrosclerotiorum]
MCIALISTAHPSYSLIIIDNRDEFLRRPTSSPDWWPEPFSYVLGSRDMARSTHGTWMGVTKQGKLAVLTNYREDKTSEAIGTYSRGRIVNSWLTGAPDEQQSTQSFVQAMVASPEAKQVGGFSLLCGRINEPLAIISNRSSDMDHITWVATEKNQTRGLSNTNVDDRTWPKILDGEILMQTAIKKHIQEGEDEDGLVERLLQVLNTDTLPRLSGAEVTVHDYITELRKSIFIPWINPDGDAAQAAETIAAAQIEDEAMKPQTNGALEQSYISGPYGTQKQTILLARPDGRVRYFERTLYGDYGKPVPLGQGDRSFEFNIEQ